MSKIDRREFPVSAASIAAAPLILPIFSADLAARPDLNVPDEEQPDWRFCSRCTSLRIPGPSRSGTGPRFNVKFDANVSIDVDRSGLTMSVGTARLKLNVSRPSAANLTGSLGIAANDLVAVLTGKDFFGDSLKAVNTGSFDLNKPVDLKIGKMLGARVGSGIAISPTFNKQSNRLDLKHEDEGKGLAVQ
jgi:hypothetical protein